MGNPPVSVDSVKKTFRVVSPGIINVIIGLLGTIKHAQSPYNCTPWGGVVAGGGPQQTAAPARRSITFVNVLIAVPVKEASSSRESP